MDLFSRDECRQIYRELWHAPRAARKDSSDQNIAHERLLDYLETLNKDDCAQMRETSPLWKAWRRREDHRALTGHAVSLTPSSHN
jgi:hypothetical protein